MSKHLIQLLICMAISAAGIAQQTGNWLLDKMPVELETAYALSALPQDLRSDATVYLLNPAKGYYLAKKGTNGFTAYIQRTNWEDADFAEETFAAISYDSAGSAAYLPVAFDVAAMRATGKYTAAQIRDTVVQRVKTGIYKAPVRTGISYMLSPLLRTRLDAGIVNMVMPHYMFYAPCIDNKDVGGEWVTGGHHPFVIGVGDVLDKAHSIFNFIIIAADETEKAKIIADNQDLLNRLAAYKSCLKVEADNMEHHH